MGSDGVRAGDGHGLARVSLRLEAEPPTIVAAGEVDLTAVPQVQDALTALRHQGHRRAVVDFAEVTFVDLAGLRAFAAAASDGFDLELRNASPLVLRVLALTGLDELLRCQTAGT